MILGLRPHPRPLSEGEMGARFCLLVVTIIHSCFLNYKLNWLLKRRTEGIFRNALRPNKQEFWNILLATMEKQHRFHTLILFLLWLLVNVYSYSRYGVKIVNDTARYLEYSDNILKHGIHFEVHNFWYLGYVLFISLFKFVGLGYGWIVAAQCVMSLLACLCLYKTGWQLTQNKIGGLLAAILFLGWIKISQWNFYIHPESIFTSLCAITFCSIIWYINKQGSILLVLCTAAITFWIKPTGFVLGLSFLIMLIASLWQSMKLRWYSIMAIYLGLMLLLVPLLNIMLASFNIVEQMATGEIIYGYSLSDRFVWQDVFILKPNRPLFLPIKGEAPLFQIVEFMMQNFSYFITLTASKLLTFVIHMKPFFSNPHNLVIALVLYPCYWFSIKGIQSHPTILLKIFTFSYLALHCLIVALTVEDWDGRFLLPLLPVIFLFAGKGILEAYLRSKRVLFQKLNPPSS